MLEKRYVEVRKVARERLKKAEREHLCRGCMQPIVAGEKVMRGDHLRCYYAILRAIKSGRTTEDQMVSEGRMLEAAKSGRKPSNPVTVELARV